MIRKCFYGNVILLDTVTFSSKEKASHYTMKEECHGAKTKTAHPPKFSVDDKYAKYRRMAKSKSP